MPVEITSHARGRMADRRVTEEDIHSALRREFHRSAGQPGTVWIHGHALGGRVLKVCVEIGDDLMRVITVAWRDR